MVVAKFATTTQHNTIPKKLSVITEMNNLWFSNEFAFWSNNISIAISKRYSDSFLNIIGKTYFLSNPSPYGIRSL